MPTLRYESKRADVVKEFRVNTEGHRLKGLVGHSRKDFKKVLQAKCDLMYNLVNLQIWRQPVNQDKDRTYDARAISQTSYLAYTNEV